jgi:hypothetical protein
MDYHGSVSIYHAFTWRENIFETQIKYIIVKTLKHYTMKYFEQSSSGSEQIYSLYCTTFLSLNIWIHSSADIYCLYFQLIAIHDLQDFNEKDLYKSVHQYWLQLNWYKVKIETICLYSWEYQCYPYPRLPT